MSPAPFRRPGRGILALPLIAVLTAASANAPAPRDADGFRLAVPPYVYAFPSDHAAHPSFRTEWWYYTGHLAARDRNFGYELTFFRVGLPRLRPNSISAWSAHDLVFVHAALTDETRGRFHFHDAARRAVLGQARADSTRYDVGLDASYARLAADRVTHELHAGTPEFAFTLALSPARPPVAHGERGVSQKSAGVGNASHYYSVTRLASRGTLVVGGESLAVVGTSWMDHEFGSSRLTDSHASWDWFSVQLDDGRELMLYSLRLTNGGTDPYSSGTLVQPDGSSRHLALSEFQVRPVGSWTSPHSGARYPSGWVVNLPAAGLELTLTPSLKDQELTAASMGGVVYWEGSVRIEGRERGHAVHGMGYVELTGYTARPPF